MVFTDAQRKERKHACDKVYRQAHRKSMNEYSRCYYYSNKNLLTVKRHEYLVSHKQETAVSVKKYAQKHSRELRVYYRRYAYVKRNTDMTYVIKSRIRRQLDHAIERYAKTGKIQSSRKYGIDYNAIITKLTPLSFPMNERDKWHIDHIRPCSSFDLTNPDQVKQCFSPENLQWLPSQTNLSKGNRTDYTK